jgi:hypothetical protein
MRPVSQAFSPFSRGTRLLVAVRDDSTTERVNVRSAWKRSSAGGREPGPGGRAGAARLRGETPWPWPITSRGRVIRDLDGDVINFLPGAGMPGPTSRAGSPIGATARDRCRTPSSRRGSPCSRRGLATERARSTAVRPAKRGRRRNEVPQDPSSVDPLLDKLTTIRYSSMRCKATRGCPRLANASRPCHEIAEYGARSSPRGKLFRGLEC